MTRRLLVRLALLLTLAIATAGCSGSTGDEPQKDADGDGISDRQETAGWVATVTMRDGPVTKTFTSDPGQKDTDGDGLEDLEESARGTDPRSLDTDGDGLLDGHDLVLDPDGGRADELRRMGVLEQPRGTFLGELDRCTEYDLKGNVWSSDLPQADGLGDGEEMRAWTITVRGETRDVKSDPCVGDTDRDGLADDLEKAFGSDPTVADTDGDGTPDGLDADPLWDLGLEIANLTGAADNGTAVTLSIALVTVAETFDVPPAAAPLRVDVNDATADRASLLVVGLLGAYERGTEAPLQLLPGGARDSLRFDVAAGTLTIAGEEHAAGPVELRGDAGSVSFDWRVTRT